PNSSPFSRFWPLNIFFSKIFFSLFLKDLDELSLNRVTTMAPFLTVFEILAFEYFFFKIFFLLFFFFSKFFFSFFLNDFNNFISNRFTTISPFLTFFQILAFEFFYFKIFFFAFSERSRRVEFKSGHNYGAIPHRFRDFGL